MLAAGRGWLTRTLNTYVPTDHRGRQNRTRVLERSLEIPGTLLFSGLARPARALQTNAGGCCVVSHPTLPDHAHSHPRFWEIRENALGRRSLRVTCVLRPASLAVLRHSVVRKRQQPRGQFQPD